MPNKETILTEEQRNKKIKWYSNPIVKKRLLDFIRFREVSLKSASYDEYCIRALSIMNESFLDYVFKFYNFFERDYSIYISDAYYKKIPFFDMNLKFRSKFTSKWFNEEAEKSIYNYTLLLDFDNKKNFIEMKAEVFKILKILNEYKISYIIIPSGNNFQIHIDNPFFFYNFEQIKNITRNIREVFNLEFLDLAGCGAKFKLMKAPFSYVNEIGLIPLNATHINNFMDWNYKKIFDSNYILSHIILKNYYGFRFNFIDNNTSKIHLDNFVNKFKLLKEIVEDFSSDFLDI